MSKPIGRTFYFEKELWTRLDDDAKRCKRSSVKQLEALLVTYFGTEDVELNAVGLEMLGEIAPQAKQKSPLIEAAPAPAAKKKRRA